MELEYGSPRTEGYNNKQATVDTWLAIGLINEAHDVVVLCSAKYQQDLRRYHNR